MKQKRFNVIDLISMIYACTILILLVLFKRKINNWALYITIYGSFLFLILIIHKLYIHYGSKKIILFLKYFYPVLTFGIIYKSIEGYVTILHDGFLDNLVINFQYIILGFQPVLWLEKFIHPVITEIFKFSYFTYYFYVPVAALILFFRKRWNDLEYFVFIITFTFYVCYIGFILFPVQGPRFALSSYFGISNLNGYLFSLLQDFLMKNGQTIGAAMPSSHLAVAWNALFLIRKFFGKKPFLIILPLTLLMSIAIVYNRYHYFMDGIAGIIVSFLCFRIGTRIYNKYNTIQE
ncbi:MAG: phosphatase PAP2 family protein [Spirochaetes bacterium]|nr:phosphatase PAP2 family protein [Spirochaetota bacterium]